MYNFSMIYFFLDLFFFRQTCVIINSKIWLIFRLDCSVLPVLKTNTMQNKEHIKEYHENTGN